MSREERRREQRSIARRRLLAITQKRLPSLEELPRPAIQPWDWGSAPINLIAFSRSILRGVLEPRKKLNDLFTVAHPEKRYILSYAALSLASGYVGMALYYMGGGSRYFNPWYLFIQPLLAALTGVLLSFTLFGAAKFIWRGDEDTRRAGALLSYFGFILIMAATLWCLHWLGLLFPEWRQRWQLLALPGSIYGLTLVVPQAARFFSLRVWAPLILGGWGIFLFALYKIPEVAEAIVSILRL